MKTTQILTCVCGLAIICTAGFSARQNQPLLGKPSQISNEWLLQEAQSLSKLACQLAAERYAVISAKGESWIMTVYDGKEIMKLSDGSHIVAFLPALTPSDRNGLIRYATGYNANVQMAADRKVKAGKYQEAKTMYQLLLRFDPGEKTLVQAEFGKRLAIVDNLIRGVDVQSNLKKMDELFMEFAAHVDFTQLDKNKATLVTNLLTAPLP